MSLSTHRVLFSILLGVGCSVPLALAVARWDAEPETSAPVPVAELAPAVDDPTARLDALPLDALHGTVLGADPVLAVPDDGFVLDEVEDESDEPARWRLDEPASMTVEVRAPLPYLAIRLQGVAGGTIRARWDGADVPVVGIGADGVATARVPGESLDRGRHRLVPHPVADPARRVTLRAVVLRHGAWRRTIGAAFHHRHRLVADFLDRGVAAAHHRETVGGLLFDGPHAERIVIEPGGPLLFRLHNASPEPARFEVATADSEHQTWLQAFEQFDWAVDVPQSAETVTARVAGSPRGLFFWGAPHRRRADPAATAAPPIVWIVLDTVRRDALGAYDPAVRWTPRLDALAARATVYDDAHSTAPWTLPAHASMLTGLYPGRHRAGVDSDLVEAAVPTLTERLRDAGWNTGGFVGAFLAGDRFGLGRGFGVFRHPGGAEAPGPEVTDAALAFLRPRVESPFFLLLNYFDAHYPYASTDERLAEVDPDAVVRRAALEPGSDARRLAEGERRTLRRLARGRLSLDQATVDLLRALYDAEVAAVDSEVGRVLDALVAAGRFDDALIVVTSDHGELFGEGGHFLHSHRLDPALLEVPLIVKYPGQTAPRRVAATVSLVDLFETVLAVAGLPPDGMPRDGVSLLDLDALARRAAVLAEEHDSPLHRLLPGVRHAEHAWAVVRSTRRAIVWKAGALCSERAAPGAAWRAAECAGARIDEDRAMLDLRVGPLESPSARSPRLAAADRARLEALGYLEPAP